MRNVIFIGSLAAQSMPSCNSCHISTSTFLLTILDRTPRPTSPLWQQIRPTSASPLRPPWRPPLQGDLPVSSSSRRTPKPVYVALLGNQPVLGDLWRLVAGRMLSETRTRPDLCTRICVEVERLNEVSELGVCFTLINTCLIYKFLFKIFFLQFSMSVPFLHLWRRMRVGLWFLQFSMTELIDFKHLQHQKTEVLIILPSLCNRINWWRR